MANNNPEHTDRPDPLEASRRSPFESMYWLISLLMHAVLVGLVALMIWDATSDKRPREDADRVVREVRVQEVARKIEADQARALERQLEDLKDAQREMRDLEREMLEAQTQREEEMTRTAAEDALKAQAEALEAQERASEAAEAAEDAQPLATPEPEEGGETQESMEAKQAQAVAAQADVLDPQARARRALSLLEDESLKKAHAEAEASQAEAEEAQREAIQARKAAESEERAASEARREAKKQAKQAEDAANKAEEANAKAEARAAKQATAAAEAEKADAEKAEASEAQKADPKNKKLDGSLRDTREAAEKAAKEAEKSVSEAAKAVREAASAEGAAEKEADQAATAAAAAAEAEGKAAEAKSAAKGSQAEAAEAQADAREAQAEAKAATEAAIASAGGAEKLATESPAAEALAETSPLDPATDDAPASDSAQASTPDPADLYEEAVEAEKDLLDAYHSVRSAQLASIRNVPLDEAARNVDAVTRDRPAVAFDPDPLTPEALALQREALDTARTQVASMNAGAAQLLNQAKGIADREGMGVDIALAETPGGGTESASASADSDAADANASTTAQQLRELAMQDENRAKDLTAAMGSSSPSSPSSPRQGGGDASSTVVSTTNAPDPPSISKSTPAYPARSLTDFDSAPSDVDWVYVDTWYTIGPFPNPGRAYIDRSFAPESAIDLDGKYTGKDNRTLRWQFVQADRPSGQRLAVNPADMEEYAIYYAYTELRFDQPRDLWIAVGSDDKSALWINDQPVWISASAHKDWRPDEGLRKVHFNAGVNRILYRIENGHGWCAFSLALHLPRK